MATPNYVRSQTMDRARAAEIDAGLRAHMTTVYGLMTGAMIITALVAYVIGTDLNAMMDGQGTTLIPEGVLSAMYGSPLRWLIILSPLAVVFGFGAMINRMSVATAQTVFWTFAGLMGLSIASIFAIYTGISIAQTFVATAAGFGAMSIYGYTTQKDLSGWGSFLIMGVVGLIVASLLNMFLFESGALQWAISLIGVLIFAGLTAYDTQSIKNQYLQMRDASSEAATIDKAATMGALRLYLDFINMFMFLLQFMGMQQE